MNRISVFLLISYLLVSSPAWSAERNLPWSEFVTRLAAANEELKASERSYQSFEFQSKASYFDDFPQVSAAVSASRDKIEDTVNNNYAVSLTASQNIFAGFLDAGKIAQGNANLHIASANLQSSKAKVSYDLKSAVAGLVYALKNVKLSQSTVQRRELNLRMIQLHFDGGRENKGSLLLSKAYLEDARLDQLQALQDLYVAQAQLAKVLGEEEGDSYSLTDQIPVTEPRSEAELDFKKLVLETPPYKTSLAQEELSKASLTQAESNFYPSLNLQASTSQYGTSWYPDQNKWSVGAVLSFPLFNGGRDYFSTQSTLESLKSSLFTKGSVQKDQLAKLKGAFSSYVQSVQKLKVDQAYVEAAEVRERISRQKYNNGLSTFDEWDIIENDLINRQKNLLVSEKNRVISEAAWEQAQGKGVLL
ncbi:MAG: TolC family protein [Pseudobdellovibrionaceae bacterium]